MIVEEDCALVECFYNIAEYEYVFGDSAIIMRVVCGWLIYCWSRVKNTTPTILY